MNYTLELSELVQDIDAAFIADIIDFCKSGLLYGYTIGCIVILLSFGVFRTLGLVNMHR